MDCYQKGETRRGKLMKQNKNIPQGYKDSPLGIIPREWKYVEFNKIAELSTRKYNPVKNEHLRCIELEHISPYNGLVSGYIDSSEQKSTKNVLLHQI